MGGGGGGGGKAGSRPLLSEFAGSAPGLDVVYKA